MQVTHWNEERKERKTELNYLKNIKSDLITEIENNNNFIQFHLGKVEASSYLLNAVEPKRLEDIELYIDNYESVFYWFNYVPNNNTFKELISSGQLRLISNEVLKNRLQELEKFYANISILENHLRREFEHYLYDVAIGNTTILELIDNKSTNTSVLKRLKINELSVNKQDKLMRDVQWLYSNEVFNNGLKLSFMNNSLLTEHHKNLDKAITSLIDLIDIEMAQ
jgi:hypothetical protein